MVNNTEPNTSAVNLPPVLINSFQNYSDAVTTTDEGLEARIKAVANARLSSQSRTDWSDAFFFDKICPKTKFLRPSLLQYKAAACKIINIFAGYDDIRRNFFHDVNTILLYTPDPETPENCMFEDILSKDESPSSP